MASDRLKELQKLQDEVELGEKQSEPREKEVNLGAGSYRVRDAQEGADEERKKLLRKKTAENVICSPLSYYTLHFRPGNAALG